MSNRSELWLSPKLASLAKLDRMLGAILKHTLENLPEDVAKEWDRRLDNAVPADVDLGKSNIWFEFMAWMLDAPVTGVVRLVDDESFPASLVARVRGSTRKVVDLLRAGCDDYEKWRMPYTRAMDVVSASEAGKVFAQGLDAVRSIEMVAEAALSAAEAPYAGMSTEVVLQDAMSAACRALDAAISANGKDGMETRVRQLEKLEELFGKAAG